LYEGVYVLLDDLLEVVAVVVLFVVGTYEALVERELLELVVLLSVLETDVPDLLLLAETELLELLGLVDFILLETGVLKSFDVLAIRGAVIDFL